MRATLDPSDGLDIARQVAFHAFVSMLAIAIAFTLPGIARFVLYDWWPRVVASSKLLLATELALAAALVLAFNALRLALESLRVRRMQADACLVHVRRDSDRAWRKARGRPPSAARDALVMTVTGFHTFVAPEAPFRDLLARCLEARVMLLNPSSEGAAERLRSLGEAAADQHRQEVAASVAYLRGLWAAGRRVRLKLYDQAPFWSIVVAGEHAWVRHCHAGRALQAQPDYVFALREDEPTQGLFPPFCSYALDRWNDPSHAEVDFATGEIVRFARDGTEARREPLALAAPR